MKRLLADDTLLGKIAWTVVTFGAAFVIKLASNVILASLLAPAIFGVMVIVNSVRMGVELLSDVGVEQNIVSHRHGLEPDFFNTAWTVQILRGALLTVLFLAVSPVLARFYAVDSGVFLAISFAPLLTGIASTSIFVLVKNLEVRKRNLFELAAEGANFVICVALALLTPTVWALVVGALLGIAARSAMSYALPHPRHRLMLRREHVIEIVRFGKWIMLTSLVIYASTNLDRLIIGAFVPLVMLGVYGIARTISDLPGNLASRVGFRVLYPLVSSMSHAEGDAAGIRREIRAMRFKLVGLAALGLGALAGVADFAIDLLYDARYAEAGWMLALLLVVSWFSLLANINEAILLGSGRPAAYSFANLIRASGMLVFLLVGYRLMGIAGAIVGMVLAEVIRVIYINFSQQRIGWSFWRQDAAATIVFLGVTAIVVGLRWIAGIPWDMFPIAPGR